VFNITFKNISITTFVAEIGVPREIHISELERRGRMVVEFTTTCAIIAYHHLSCEFEPRWNL
jgi:hypothetical protein